MIDISTLSLNELQALRTQIERQIEARKADEVAKVREQILALANSVGMKVEDILNTKAPAQKKPLIARFQNPDNPKEQWSGRGRQPKWVKEHLEAGKSFDDLKMS